MANYFLAQILHVKTMSKFNSINRVEKKIVSFIIDRGCCNQAKSQKITFMCMQENVYEQIPELNY